VLHLDRGPPVLLLDEIEVDAALDGEHAAHQADEQDDILGAGKSLRFTRSSRRPG
jgi:hypothetical protein